MTRSRGRVAHHSSGGGATSPGGRPMSSGTENGRRRWLVWLPACLVLVVFARSVGFDFVNWDDGLNVYQNEYVTRTDGILQSWKDWRNPGYYPLYYASLWTDWHAGGGRPWLFHLNNVLLHAISAVLVAFILTRVKVRLSIAVAIAALWAVHPIQVGSVAWVTERKNLLYVFFFLWSMLCFLHCRADGEEGEGRRGVWYTWSLVMFVCSLLSKGTAVALPVVLPFLQWLRGGRLDRRFWVSWVPYLLLALSVGLLHIGRERVETLVSLPDRILIAASGVWFYLCKFLLPVKLIPVYPRWDSAALGLIHWAALGGVIIATVVVWLRRGRIGRLSVFGSSFALINLSLVVGLVWFPYMRISFVSDHLVYLPLLGAAICAVLAVDRVAGRFAPAVLCVWIALLSVKTFVQQSIWHDSKTLWSATLDVHPECDTALVNLGMALESDGEVEAAIRYYRRALEVLPLQVESHINLGVALGRLGAYDEARPYLEWVVRNQPQHKVGWFKLGRLLVQSGAPEEALDYLHKAASIDPRDGDILSSLGDAYLRLGEATSALGFLRRAVVISSDSASVHNNLALCLSRIGQRAEAEQEFRSAIRLRPDYASAKIGLGNLLFQRDDLEAALRCYQEASQVASSESARAGVCVGLVLERMGRTDEAIKTYRSVLAGDPTYGDASLALAQTYQHRSQFAEAIEVLREGVGESPRRYDVANNLAWLLATCPDDGLRDGAEAVRLAEEVCAATYRMNAGYLDTLACAYAEAGRFDEAVATAKQAAELARVQGEHEAAESITERLESFEKAQPYRVPQTGR